MEVRQQTAKYSRPAYRILEPEPCDSPHPFILLLTFHTSCSIADLPLPAGSK
jgi:hypothetical protein